MALSKYQRKEVERIQRMQRDGLEIDAELKKLPPDLAEKIRLTQTHAQAGGLKAFPKRPAQVR
jgi:hypothetical protein